MEDADKFTVSTATRFEVHITDEEGAGSIGNQNSEYHCRTVAMYLTSRMVDVMATCSFYAGVGSVGSTWQNFATYIKGREATDEQVAAWLKHRML